ncbi:hypothetical protein [Fibrella aquatilis]|uniref:Uncharacterized protein n=1 Tax=Fibrella aquatilis TaxID=2817059 RepID=A0A939JZC4_9BACT|nr:hypothetical protein [Fibrella aquatilis]MBO0930791.1 hypothetical protein [Fibrella aquatilis]
MTIDERIDRLELRLVELSQRIDTLYEMYEKLLAIGITLDADEIKAIQQQLAKSAINLENRQN